MQFSDSTRFYSLCFGLFFMILGSLHAQQPYDIRIKIDGYASDTLLIAFSLTDKQYIADTVYRGEDDFFTFQGDSLASGIYLGVMQPENTFFQFLVTDEERSFTMLTERDMQIGKTTFTDAPDNTLLYSYFDYLNAQSAKAQEYQAEGEAGKAKMEQLNEEVVNYQKQLIADHPDYLTAAIIRVNLPNNPPTFEGTEEDVQLKQWRWMQAHYFDNVDLSDERLLRTPTAILYDRIDYFVHKLHVQHPDTISQAIDKVLEKMPQGGENFRVYLIHFLNDAARSKLVGMDAVYVHLVDNYYAKGLAPWSDEEQLEKIVDNADKLRPILIGKTAPNFTAQRKDGSRVSLHEVDSPFTILYFWRYDCGHCKESTPIMKEFYETYKEKGVEIFALCTKTGDKVPPCWEYIDEKEIGNWLHTTDPYLRSGYHTLYDVQTTPQIFILDADKKIISKRIGAEQLSEVMDRILEDAAIGGGALEQGR